MSEPYQETRRCDHCEQEYWPGPGVVELPFGTFCSTACADIEEAAFSERMTKQGFMVWDHEGNDDPVRQVRLHPTRTREEV